MFGCRFWVRALDEGMPGVGSRFTASYCASPPAGLKIPAPGDALSQNTEEGWSVFPPARVGVCCLERPHQGRGHGSILNPQPHGWDLLMAGKSGGRHRESGTAPSPPAAGWRCWGGAIQHRTPSLPCMPGQMLNNPSTPGPLYRGKCCLWEGGN